MMSCQGMVQMQSKFHYLCATIIPQHSFHGTPAKFDIDFCFTPRPVTRMAALCRKVQAEQFIGFTVAMQALITVP
jgi:hypothetical protein